MLYSSLSSKISGKVLVIGLSIVVISWLFFDKDLYSWIVKLPMNLLRVYKGDGAGLIFVVYLYTY